MRNQLTFIRVKLFIAALEVHHSYDADCGRTLTWWKRTVMFARVVYCKYLDCTFETEILQKNLGPVQERSRWSSFIITVKNDEKGRHQEYYTIYHIWYSWSLSNYESKKTTIDWQCRKNTRWRNSQTHTWKKQWSHENPGQTWLIKLAKYL